MIPRDEIDEKLAAINERIARDRAAGIPPRCPPLPSAGIARRPAPDSPADRAEKQATWDSLLLHEPEIAQAIRVLGERFGKLDVKTVRVPGMPIGMGGPPWHSVVISIDVTQTKKPHATTRK